MLRVRSRRPSHRPPPPHSVLDANQEGMESVIMESVITGLLLTTLPLFYLASSRFPPIRRGHRAQGGGEMVPEESRIGEVIMRCK
jgi:hypothetical protein